MSRIEDSVCADIQTRADLGAKKYGVTMERTDLSETQWLQHAYEEALDLAVYLKKILTEREKERAYRPFPECFTLISAPSLGTPVFLATTVPGFRAKSKPFTGSEEDMEFLRLGILHLTEEDAWRHINKMLELPGETK